MTRGLPAGVAAAMSRILMQHGSTMENGYACIFEYISKSTRWAENHRPFDPHCGRRSGALDPSTQVPLDTLEMGSQFQMVKSPSSIPLADLSQGAFVQTSTVSASETLPPAGRCSSNQRHARPEHKVNTLSSWKPKLVIVQSANGWSVFTHITRACPSTPALGAPTADVHHAPPAHAQPRTHHC